MEKFHEDLGIKINTTIAYHFQKDGQSEGTIQTLVDMIGACVIEFGGSWDTYLLLAEISYNNSYDGSIDMHLYEMLYEIKCKTPICWDEVGQLYSLVQKYC